METAAIILAAGNSSRMGKPKSLLPWADRPLLEHQLCTLMTCKIDPIIVVLGRDERNILSALPHFPGVKFKSNPNPQMGRSHSIKLGVREVSASDSKQVIIVNVDQPLSSVLINRLINAGNQNPNSALVLPKYREAISHPPLIRAHLYDELTSLTEDSLGLRRLIDRFKHTAILVDIPDPEIPPHFNTPNEYEAALKNHQK
tara:strand:+ start:661 stop:1263 length:603 start_codon:yes stop_codon:yes gene_type:complete